MCWKIKTTVFFMWLASWRTDISSFYCSDINLFLIDYAWCKLSNKWLLLYGSNCMSITIQELKLKFSWKFLINFFAITSTKLLKGHFLQNNLEKKRIFISQVFLKILFWNSEPPSTQTACQSSVSGTLEIIQNANTLNVPNHHHIFWLNFGKPNHSFLHLFLLLGETDFWKSAAWGNE